MAKSKIIKELVNDEISLASTLKRIVILANDLENWELKTWAENELRGYDRQEETIPEYRKIYSTAFYYSGLINNLQIKNASLDIGYLDKDILEEVKCYEMRESVSCIEKYLKDYKDGISIDRTILAPYVYKNSGHKIQCISISQTFSISQVEKIIQTISSKALNVLLKLDKEFGCLDDLDIGCDKMSKKKANEVKEEINLIVNGDVKISKSQVALNDSKIDSKRTVTKNKNSNTGKGSNHVEKHTDVKIDADITTEKQEKEKKECWLKKIFHKRSK